MQAASSQNRHGGFDKAATVAKSASISPSVISEILKGKQGKANNVR
jgi:hypothetical protein